MAQLLDLSFFVSLMDFLVICFYLLAFPLSLVRLFQRYTIFSVLSSHNFSVKLWIDDQRPPPSQDWVWASNLKEAYEAIVRYPLIKIISFDHDLGEEDTTMPIALWLEEQAYHGYGEPIIWRVHSYNPVGRRNLIDTLERADFYWEQKHGRIENRG